MRPLPQSVVAYLSGAKERLQAARDKDRKSADVLQRANAAALRFEYEQSGIEMIETAGMVISPALLASLGADVSRRRHDDEMNEAAE